MDTVSEHLVFDRSVDHKETTNFGEIETGKTEELNKEDSIDIIQD